MKTVGAFFKYFIYKHLMDSKKREFNWKWAAQFRETAWTVFCPEIEVKTERNKTSTSFYLQSFVGEALKTGMALRCTTEWSCC